MEEQALRGNHGRGMESWSSTHGGGIGAAHDRPVPMPFKTIHAGNTPTHVSHALYEYRGLVYCNKCGCRGESHRLRKLSKPCQSPTQYGRDAIMALANGRPPPRLSHWPE